MDKENFAISVYPSAPDLCAHRYLIMRLDGPLFFGSVEHVEKRLKEIYRNNNIKQKHWVLALKAVGKIDLSRG